MNSLRLRALLLVSISLLQRLASAAVCSKGYTGVYPNCDYCPRGTSTVRDGNNVPCTCYQPTKEAETYDWEAVKCKACDTKHGWYPRAVFTNPSSYKFPAGKVCVKCKNNYNHNDNAGMVVKGGKCACNTAKGYGYALEPLGVGSTYTYCIKCSGEHKVLDKKTGRCMCKAGYGVPPLQSYNYCVPCKKSVGTVKQGYCHCKAGYAFTSDAALCIKCSGPRYTKLGNTGICSCGTGYEGRPYASSGCDKCPSPGMTTQKRANDYNACICKDRRMGLHYPDSGGPHTCVCRWGFQPSGSTCTYTPWCSSKRYKVEYWTGSRLAGWDGKGFPVAVLGKAPSSSAEVASLAAWPAVPKGAKASKVAVRITRCVCLIHKDWDFQAQYGITKGDKGAATLIIDGGQTERGSGDYYDQNVNLRPGVIYVLPVNGTLTGGAKTLTLLSPQYGPNNGPYLSGMDNIPEAFNYEACHNVTVLYWSSNGLGKLSITLPGK